MPWSLLPCPTGLDQVDRLQKFSFINQFHEAIRDRLDLLNTSCPTFFPATSIQWGTGLVANLVDNGDGTLTLTATTLDGSSPGWSTSLSGLCSGKQYNRTCTGDACVIPSHYDVVIEGDGSRPADLLKFIRLQITDNTANTLTLQSSLTTKNAITAKFISSLGELIGKVFYVYKRDTGLHYHERRPTMPADQEKWKGTVETGWVDSSGNAYLRQIVRDYNPDPYDDPTADFVVWAKDKWKNLEVLAFDEDGLLRRLKVLGNVDNILVVGRSVYRLTVTASAGTYTITAGGTATTPIPFNATSAVIQSAFSAIGFIGSNVTVAGGGPYDISFTAALGAVKLETDETSLSGTAVLGKPFGAKTLTGFYLIVAAGARQMPGRTMTQILAWYGGYKTGYISWNVDDQLADMQKPYPFYQIAVPDLATGCKPDLLSVFDIDARIPSDDTCECGSAGDFINPYMFKTWRGLQLAALGIVEAFADPFNTFGDGQTFRTLVAATALYYVAKMGVNVNPNAAWKTTGTYSSGKLTLGSTNSPPYLPIGAYYAVEDAHGTLVAWGAGSIDVDGKLSSQSGGFSSDYNGYTITLSFGFTRVVPYHVLHLYRKRNFIPDISADGMGHANVADPPAITPGGELTTPANIVLKSSHVGGVLNYNTTYYYRVSATNASGETLASSEVGILTNLAGHTDNTYTITSSWDPVVGASDYKIYRSASSGAELFIGSVPAYSTSFVDDGSVTPSGALPVSNTTHNDCFGAGTWINRGPSTGKCNRSTFGFMGESADGFIVGKFYRYIGDNFNHPFSGQGPVTQTSLLDNYWARFYRGTYKKTTQVLREASKTGKATSVTRYSLTDTIKAWWTDVINSGELRIQGGTATGGSSITLVDSTIVTSNKACWWAVNRHLGNGPYEGFVIEIYKGGLPAGWSVAADGSASWSGGDQPKPNYKIPIAGFAGTSVTFANSIAVSVGAGDGWLIREPRYEVSKWTGRNVTVKKKVDGSSVTIDITDSDNDTIFFDRQSFDIDETTAYTINEFRTGVVLKYQTIRPAEGTAYVKLAEDSYFVAPSGTDSRGNAPFKKNLKMNTEDFYKDYGFWMADDRWTHYIPNELYELLKLLWLVKYDIGSWIGGPDAVGVSWGGGEWENITRANSNPLCDLGLYTAYGISGGFDEYEMATKVGSQSINPAVGPPYGDAGAPQYAAVITSATICFDGILAHGYSLEGIWNGPLSASAYLAGRFVGNCKVPDGNGVEVNLYDKANFPCADAAFQAAHPDTHFYCEYQPLGAGIGPENEWYNFATVTTSSFDPKWDGDVQDGSFVSSLVGSSDTAIVTVTYAGLDHQVPPLPLEPSPDCPPVDCFNPKSAQSGHGFYVIGWFATIDWRSYLEYSA